MTDQGALLRELETLRQQNQELESKLRGMV